MRAGKNLPVHVHRGARRAAPRRRQRCSPSTSSRAHDANYFRFQLNPRDLDRGRRAGQGARRRLRRASNVELYLCNDHPDEASAYERLLGDALDGETLLFAREDGVEASWRVVDNVLTDHAPAIPYPVHSWGPEEQQRFIPGPDHWHNPVVDPDEDC